MSDYFVPEQVGPEDRQLLESADYGAIYERLREIRGHYEDSAEQVRNQRYRYSLEESELAFVLAARNLFNSDPQALAEWNSENEDLSEVFSMSQQATFMFSAVADSSFKSELYIMDMLDRIHFGDDLTSADTVTDQLYRYALEHDQVDFLNAELAKLELQITDDRFWTGVNAGNDDNITLTRLEASDETAVTVTEQFYIPEMLEGDDRTILENGDLEAIAARIQELQDSGELTDVNIAFLVGVESLLTENSGALDAYNVQGALADLTELADEQNMNLVAELFAEMDAFEPAEATEPAEPTEATGEPLRADDGTQLGADTQVAETQPPEDPAEAPAEPTDTEDGAETELSAEQLDSQFNTLYGDLETATPQEAINLQIQIIDLVLNNRTVADQLFSAQEPPVASQDVIMNHFLTIMDIAVYGSESEADREAALADALPAFDLITNGNDENLATEARQMLGFYGLEVIESDGAITGIQATDFTAFLIQLNRLDGNVQDAPDAATRMDAEYAIACLFLDEGNAEHIERLFPGASAEETHAESVSQLLAFAGNGHEASREYLGILLETDPRFAEGTPLRAQLEEHTDLFPMLLEAMEQAVVTGGSTVMSLGTYDTWPELTQVWDNIVAAFPDINLEDSLAAFSMNNGPDGGDPSYMLAIGPYIELTEGEELTDAASKYQDFADELVEAGLVEADAIGHVGIGTDTEVLLITDVEEAYTGEVTDGGLKIFNAPAEVIDGSALAAALMAIPTPPEPQPETQLQVTQSTQGVTEPVPNYPPGMEPAPVPEEDPRAVFLASPVEADDILRVEELIDGKGWRNENTYSDRFNGITNNYTDVALVNDAIARIEDVLGDRLTEDEQAMLTSISNRNQAGYFVGTPFAVEGLRAYRAELPEGQQPSQEQYARALLAMLTPLDNDDAFILDTADIDEHLNAGQVADLHAEVTAIDNRQTGLRG